MPVDELIEDATIRAMRAAVPPGWKALILLTRPGNQMAALQSVRVGMQEAVMMLTEATQQLAKAIEAGIDEEGGNDGH